MTEVFFVVSVTNCKKNLHGIYFIEIGGMDMNCVPISEMIDEFNLVSLVPEMDLKNKTIDYPDVNRLSLQLTGFFDYFAFHRLQIIGLVEYTYLKRMESSVRKKNLKKIFEYHIPCIVICRGLEPFPEMISYAKKNDVPILSSSDSTSDFTGEVIRWLKTKLAPSTTLHGVLVDVYGEGILIMGESGIGKSETAIELIKRGHRFVADDVVEIKRVSQRTLVGTSPDSLKYFMELRGIGIIDVKQMFGIESIKETQSIDAVIQLELWDNKKKYDRIGLEDKFIDILGNKVACYSIPIRPGRNIAVICESAAINHRQRKMNLNSGNLFTRIKNLGG